MRQLNPHIVATSGGSVRVGGRPVTATPPVGPFGAPGTVTVWVLDGPGEFLVRAQTWGPHAGEWVATVMADIGPVHVFAEQVSP